MEFIICRIDSQLNSFFFFFFKHYLIFEFNVFEFNYKPNILGLKNYT